MPSAKENERAKAALRESGHPQISDELHRWILKNGDNIFGPMEERAEADMAAVYAELARRRGPEPDEVNA